MHVLKMRHVVMDGSSVAFAALGDSWEGVLASETSETTAERFRFLFAVLVLIAIVLPASLFLVAHFRLLVWFLHIIVPFVVVLLSSSARATQTPRMKGIPSPQPRIQAFASGSSFFQH